MIKRSDGGNAGGVLTLTDEMRSSGARPIWLGYLHVEDVDATVAAIKADGGQVTMPPWDQAGVGRLAMVTDPQGAPFYLMNPLPPEGDPDATSDVFSTDKAAACPLERIVEQRSGQVASTSTGATSAGARTATWIWAKWASIASSSMMAS